MPTKKRKIPEAVKVHRERKARLTASMAQRQGAALGKSARERLKPLLDAAPVADDDDSPPSFGSLSSDAIKRIADNWLSSLQPQWSFRPQPSSLVWPTLGSFSVDSAPAAPTIDAAKLEALRNAEPYKPQMRVPDMVHVITGWRGWTLKNGRLGALGIDETWPAKEALRATCKNGGNENHLAPAWSCQCGVWAFKDLDLLIAAIGSSYKSIKVIGSVSLWGRVIETENGYRAQYAYPSELWLLDGALEELGLIYDVPIRRVG